MHQELIFIDISNSVAMFYNIKIEKNKKQYYLIVTSGRIGNKGKTIIIYKGQDYSHCKNEFWKRVNDKKQQKYKNLNEVSSTLDSLFGLEKSRCACDICGKELSEKLYNKINLYLRNETEVDSDGDNQLFGKVACFECQHKFGVYKGKDIF